MGLPLIDIDDFVNEYSLAIDQYSEPILEDIIRNGRQEYYIKLMLGNELGQAFIDDLDGSGDPVSAKFIAINSDLTFEINECVIAFSGLSRNIVRALFRDYVSQQPTINLNSGNSTVLSEAAQANNELKAVVTWNKFVSDNDRLAAYMRKNSATYPEYKYQILFPSVL